MKHSLIIAYLPYNSALPALYRHIADMTDAPHAVLDAVVDGYSAKARTTAPAGYEMTASVLVNTGDPVGYASCMAHVNMGVPGYPA